MFGRFKYWQVLALKYTKEINWKIKKIVVAMETVRKISNFFAFVFITQYNLKMGKVSEKSIFFSISKPYWKVSHFLREWLLISEAYNKQVIRIIICPAKTMLLFPEISPPLNIWTK